MLSIRFFKNVPGWAVWTFKILIAALAIRFILQKVFTHESIDDLEAALKSLGDDNSRTLLYVVFLLMLINLFTETLKWKIIMRPLEKISPLRSFMAVLTGISVSFFVPNRSGEFVGRILYLSEADKIKASIVTVLASIAQLVITVSAGSLCLAFYFRTFVSSALLYYPLGAILLLVSGGLIFLFIYFPYWASRFASLKILNKFSGYISVLNLYRPKHFFVVLILSLLRYLVFVHQYYLLQKIFFPETPYAETLQMISIIYLALAVIPTFAFSEIGVRSSVALYYLSGIISNPVSITLATLSIWIINIAIPSIAGSVFFLSVKIKNGKTPGR